MNDPLEAKTPLFGGKAAAILGGIFLGAFVICAVLVGLDRAQRTRLEIIAPQPPAANVGGQKT